MAHISAGVEYALHSLLYLVDTEEGPRASARDLAELQRLPAEFVSKIFTKLQKKGIVNAQEGIRGGFTLTRDPAEISVLDVVEAIDGRKSMFDCKGIRGQCALFGDAPPDWAIAGVCSVHAVMLEAEKKTREVLASQSLRDLAGRVQSKVPSEHSESVREWMAMRLADRRGAGKSP